MANYLPYSDQVETIAPDEAETIQSIIDTMTKGMHHVRDQHGGTTSVRVSHAKAHGFLKGTLSVDAGLPPELTQGLFAKPGTYEVVARLATVPGELLDDRKVSTPRGMAIKVLGVAGPTLHDAATQDFVLDTGKTFNAPSAKAFAIMFQPNARVAPAMSDTAKGIVSKVSRATNAALNAVGMNSANLDFYGHPNVHPLGEAYFSQAAFRYGDYVAKLSITPANPALEALYQQKLDIDDENALRVATVRFFREHGATYDVSIQLALNSDKMPIEDATVEWPEDLSPYRKVGQLSFPPQDAFDPAKQDMIDYQLSFAPSHTLAAHRPLGSIQRARMAVYPVLQRTRHAETARAEVEPKTLSEIPG